MHIYKQIISVQTQHKTPPNLYSYHLTCPFIRLPHKLRDCRGGPCGSPTCPALACCCFPPTAVQRMVQATVCKHHRITEHHNELTLTLLFWQLLSKQLGMRTALIAVIALTLTCLTVTAGDERGKTDMEPLMRRLSAEMGWRGVSGM